MNVDHTRKECPRCQADLSDSTPQFPDGTRRISLYDREKDCTVAYKCPDCGGTWPRSIAEVLLVQEIT